MINLAKIKKAMEFLELKKIVNEKLSKYPYNYKNKKVEYADISTSLTDINKHYSYNGRDKIDGVSAIVYEAHKRSCYHTPELAKELNAFPDPIQTIKDLGIRCKKNITEEDALKKICDDLDKRIDANFEFSRFIQNVDNNFEILPILNTILDRYEDDKNLHYKDQQIGDISSLLLDIHKNSRTFEVYDSYHFVVMKSHNTCFSVDDNGSVKRMTHRMFNNIKEHLNKVEFQESSSELEKQMSMKMLIRIDDEVILDSVSNAIVISKRKGINLNSINIKITTSNDLKDSLEKELICSIENKVMFHENKINNFLTSHWIDNILHDEINVFVPLDKDLTDLAFCGVLKYDTDLSIIAVVNPSVSSKPEKKEYLLYTEDGKPIIKKGSPDLQFNSIVSIAADKVEILKEYDKNTLLNLHKNIKNRNEVKVEEKPVIVNKIKKRNSLRI